MLKYIVIGLALYTCACSNPNPDNKYVNDHRAQFYTSRCIQYHLNEMSDSDHVQSWDSELYKEVAKECNYLFMDNQPIQYIKK